MPDEECHASTNKVGDYLREFIFQQDNVQRPELDLSDPAGYDVNTNQAHAFFIPSQDGQIGAWFLEPEEETEEERVILYLHGVKGTRGRGHRVELYNVLLKEGFKILTIDYRGFGDSTDTSEDEDTVVQDAQAALDWLTDKVTEECKIFVWGHSMGTGVASHAVAEEFMTKGTYARVDGVILEAPFNNFTDELIHYTKNTSNAFAKSAISALYASTGQTVPGALLKLFNMEFNSDCWVPNIYCPVMILHAKDDAKIPFALAEKLFNDVKEAGKRNIKLYSFDGDIEHHTIYKSEDLPGMVNSFTEKSKLEKNFIDTRLFPVSKGKGAQDEELPSNDSSQIIFSICFLAACVAYFVYKISS